MSKIERVEKQVETKEVETSETVTVYACDVCGHEYDDESELSELHKNPSVRGKYTSLKELSEVIEAVHFQQDERSFRQQDYPMIQGGRRTDLVRAISDELNKMKRETSDPTYKTISFAGINPDNYYKTGGIIDIFVYNVNIEPKSDARYDVCDDCYSVVFDGA